MKNKRQPHEIPVRRGGKVHYIGTQNHRKDKDFSLIAGLMLIWFGIAAVMNVAAWPEFGYLPPVRNFSHQLELLMVAAIVTIVLVSVGLIIAALLFGGGGGKDTSADFFGHRSMTTARPVMRLTLRIPLITLTLEAGALAGTGTMPMMAGV